MSSALNRANIRRLLTGLGLALAVVFVADLAAAFGVGPLVPLVETIREFWAALVGAVRFRTKPLPAREICADMIADHTMPPWAAGDEVCGRSGQLREFFEQHEIGYVLRVGCAFAIRAALAGANLVA